MYWKKIMDHDQWISNFGMRQAHLEGLLKHSFLPDWYGSVGWCCPTNQGIISLIPSLPGWGTCWGCKFSPPLERV